MLEVTADATYYENKSEEQRTDEATWLNRPFSKVTFDGNPQVATATSITDIISGTKDGGFEQQYRAVKDRLQSYGLNLKLGATDNLTLTLDGHHLGRRGDAEQSAGSFARRSSPSPRRPLPVRRCRSSTASPSRRSPSTTIRQRAATATTMASSTSQDLGSQVARSTTSFQQQKMPTKFASTVPGSSADDDRVDFGASYPRQLDDARPRVDTYQPLGDWGVANVGDVQQYAAGVVTPFCLTCEFQAFRPARHRHLVDGDARRCDEALYDAAGGAI